MAPQKIIIDTDPGVDDVLAILLALASPEVDLTLISIVFGNTHAPVAYKNLLKIYHQLAQEIAAIPEAAGRYKRLASEAGKTKLSLGEDGPVGGDKAVAAYFVSPVSNYHGKADPRYIAWAGWVIEYIGNSPSFHPTRALAWRYA
jgi:inosine-uridine nucleoside N-ribohydrolase